VLRVRVQTELPRQTVAAAKEDGEALMDLGKRLISTTTDGQPPAPGMERGEAPQPVNPATGQHGAYWVLNEEERAKGFVRPVRSSYRHVGVRPKHPLRDLTAEEQERFKDLGYVKFEQYPDGESCVGKYWTKFALSSGCGAVTTMGLALAETYARNPRYYGATFCTGCSIHLPVAEFVWYGTEERVGS